MQLTYSSINDYVSNLDDNVYTISNLPEEVIAVVFAYVSRSPESFRDNILKISEQKASKFHEKWVLEYGHSSIAEHATIHIGIEKVSRLFSAVLERSNLFISPIEYSQRYQKPKSSDFYIPVELEKAENSELKAEYIDFQNQCYKSYEYLFCKLLERYKYMYSSQLESGDMKLLQLEKISFEDARYALSLGVFTNLGLTANARAMEEGLSYLLSSPYSEVKCIGEKIKREVCKKIPTLVKYADECNFYSKEFALENISKYVDDSAIQLVWSDEPKLTCFTGNQSHNPLKYALITLLSDRLYHTVNHDRETIINLLKKKNNQDLSEMYLNMMKGFDINKDPSSMLKEIMYNIELTMSEACWHQLLRHRQIKFTSKYPSTNYGIVIPSSIFNMGLGNVIEQLHDNSKTLFNKFMNADMPYVAHYVTLNAHKRKTTAFINLADLYHLMKLRLSPHAQWEIKELVISIVKKISEIHQVLLEPILEILNEKNPELKDMMK